MMANKRTILVVDDDPAIRQSLAATLLDAGYSVRLAVDGISALAELNDFKPDILLSDLTMPGRGGRELLATVRRRFPAIRLIATSGAYSVDEVRREWWQTYSVRRAYTYLQDSSSFLRIS
jgi:CheY-like chemotaxis protein